MGRFCVIFGYQNSEYHNVLHNTLKPQELTPSIASVMVLSWFETDRNMGVSEFLTRSLSPMIRQESILCVK